MFAGLGAVGRVGRHGLGGGSGAASASKRPNYSVDLTKGQLGKDMVFSRASVGTYYDSAGVLRTAGVNVPRFDYDPVTLAPRGLLLEDTSTNLIFPSADLTVWIPQGANGAAAPIVTGDQITAPDGTLTAESVVFPDISALNAVSQIVRAVTVTSAVHTYSVYLRGAVGGEKTYIYHRSVAYFPPILCTLTTRWQRFVITTPALTAGTWNFYIGTDLRDPQHAATPAQTIYAWGAQVEQSDHATSYIATTAAAVTRAIDNCLLAPSASWFDGFANGKGTWFAEFDYLDATPINGAEIIGMGGSPGSAPPMRILSGRNIGQSDGAATMNSSTVTAVNEVTRAATTWQPGQAKVCANGGVVATSALLAYGYASAMGFFGAGLMSVGGGLSCEGHLRVLKYWKRILSDTEMQSITALGDPSLSLDFMTPGVLDSRITFTRASTATYFDSSGVMRTAAVNAPRWDYDPSTRVLNGLLIEDTRTNSIRNSTMQGAVVGAPGTMPTNWLLGGSAGVTPQVVGIGTENGIPYIDLQFVGTTVNTATQILPETTTAIAAANGQTWTNSSYLRLISGTLTNFTGFQLFTNETTAAGAAVKTNLFALATPTPSPLASQRQTYTVALTGGGTVGAVHSRIVFNMNIGVAVDATFRIGAPQMELGAFATSFIPTISVAVTRAVEACTIPPANMSPWFASPGGSWFAEFDYFDNAPSNARILGRPNFGGGSNSALTVSAARLIGQYDSSAGVSAANATASNTITKAASTWAPGLAKVCANGGAVASGTTMINGYSTYVTYGVALMVNGFAGSSDNLSGHIRKVQYWPRTLTDAEMQAKTLADVSTPSLVLDFMQPGVLDPRLVMSRASVATYFDATGTMQTAANNQARWDYDINNGSFRGVLIENTRTNGVSNSTMQGVIAGTPGTPPTNWSYALGAGLSTQVVGRGTDKGIPYVDIRFFGTVVATGPFNVYFDTPTSIPAVTGQRWCLAFYWKMTAGTMTGLTGAQMSIREVDAGGAITSDHLVALPSPGTGVFAMQRMIYTNLLLNGGVNTAFVRPMIQFLATAATAINMTLRIGAPQVEQGPFETSFIPTSGSAVTRAADDMYMPLGPWFSTTNSSLFAEYLYARSADAQFAHNPVGIGDGASGANNKFVIRAAGVNFNPRSMFSKRAGVAANVNAPGSAALFAPNKVAASWDASVGMVTAAGLAPGVGGSQVPLNLIQLVVGNQDTNSGEYLDGCIRKIMYWNKTLSATELQSVTT